MGRGCVGWRREEGEGMSCMWVECMCMWVWLRRTAMDAQCNRDPRVLSNDAF